MKRAIKSGSKPEERLIDLLLAIRRGEKSDIDATRELREHVLSVGSATRGNINCANRLEVGRVRHALGRINGNRGVKVRGRRVLLSDIFHVAEDAPIPKDVAEEYPQLTDSQWKACMRFVTLLLTSLEEDT